MNPSHLWKGNSIFYYCTAICPQNSSWYVFESQHSSLKWSQISKERQTRSYSVPCTHCQDHPLQGSCWRQGNGSCSAPHTTEHLPCQTVLHLPLTPGRLTLALHIASWMTQLLFAYKGKDQAVKCKPAKSNVARTLISWSVQQFHQKFPRQPQPWLCISVQRWENQEVSWFR